MLKIKDDYFIHEESKRRKHYYHFDNITSITIHGSRFDTEEEFEEESKKTRGLWHDLEASRIAFLNYQELIGSIVYKIGDFLKCESDYEKLIKAHAAYHKKVKNEEKSARIEDRCQWDSAECDQVIEAFIYGAEMQRRYCVGADCTALSCEGCKHIIDSINYRSNMRRK
jgi:hypothetical protein